MFCPKIQGECIREDCMAFKKGVFLSVISSSILLSNVFGEVYTEINMPLTLSLDLGTCAEYNRVIDPDGLMIEVQKLVNENSTV